MRFGAAKEQYDCEKPKLTSQVVKINGNLQLADAPFREGNPLTVRVKEACRLTGMGRSKLYELIAEGAIEIIKVGTMTLIPTDSLQRFIEAQRNHSC